VRSAQPARKRHQRSSECASFPRFLKPAIPFDQLLHVLFLDGVIEHRPRVVLGHGAAKEFLGRQLCQTFEQELEHGFILAHPESAISH
jgi:hypothetical protein